VGDFLNDIVEWMTALPVLSAYVMILIIAYGENVLPPIPGDMIVVFGGYLVGVGRLEMPLVILLATIGGAAGFMTMYAIGKRLGVAVAEEGRFRWIPVNRIKKSKELLGKWGYSLILANRFLSGLRSVISLTVGMAEMPAAKVSVYATISALAWTAILTYLGFFLGDHWEEVSVYLRTYGTVVTVIIGLFIGIQVYLGYRSRRKAVSKNDAPTEPSHGSL
jgi:membrane protein DedA with SNARE-associated domain